LLDLPETAFSALLEVERVGSRTAVLAFEGSRYSVPPGLVGQTATVWARLGELHPEIISPANRRSARHSPAAAGAGRVPQSGEHVRLLASIRHEAFRGHDGLR